LLLPLAALALLWLLANQMQVHLVQQLLLPAIVLLWLGAAFSVRLLQALLMPVALIYLAVPVWDVLVYPLRLIALAVVEFWLEFGGYDLSIDGFYIIVPAGEFVVAESCSGLNYLLASMALAVVYSVLYLRRIRSRLLFTGVCVALSLLVNWIRVFALVLIGFYSDMRSSLLDEHTTFGLILFTLALIPIFWVGTVLERSDSGAAEVPVEIGRKSQALNDTRLRTVVLATFIAVSAPSLAGLIEHAAL
jgi:exosortase